MQNLVVFFEPSNKPCDISWKAGNMCLNRFCIDEDAACELSGINYFQTAVSPVPIDDSSFRPEVKGTELLVSNIQIS